MAVVTTPQPPPNPTKTKKAPSLTPEEIVEPTPDATIPARWRRKQRHQNNAKKRHDAEQAALLAQLKAHFDEIDAIELKVETPTPPGKILAQYRHSAWKPQKPRAMALGLSSVRRPPHAPRGTTTTTTTATPLRLSSAHLPSPSPLRLNLNRTSLLSLHTLNEEEGEATTTTIVVPSLVGDDEVPSHRVSTKTTGTTATTTTAAMPTKSARPRSSSMASLQPIPEAGDNTGRRSSVLTTVGGGRRSSVAASTAARMFSRLSLRISDALGKVSIGGGGGGGEGVGGGKRSSAAAGAVPKESENVEKEEEEEEFGNEDVTGVFTICEEEEEEEEEEASATTTPFVCHVDTTAAIATANKTPTSSTSTTFSNLCPFDQLLRLCGQHSSSSDNDDDDTGASSLPSMDELLGRHVDLSKVKKIGEGTFGEAYKAGTVVLKIVPMEGSVLVNGEPQKRAEEILAEVAITLTLSGLRSDENNAGRGMKRRPNTTSGFAETHGVGICRGRYAEALRKEWHRWNAQNKSENDPVDIFQEDQLYVVFVVADGGLDLEHFEPRSFAEIQSIMAQVRCFICLSAVIGTRVVVVVGEHIHPFIHPFIHSSIHVHVQVTMTLAVAEEACEFEHRDLHWGNLLISRDGTRSVAYRLRYVDTYFYTHTHVRAHSPIPHHMHRDVDIVVEAAGVRVTLIDFTLSRLVTADGEVAYCDLAADPALFQGPKGDVQAETYRRMQRATQDEWHGYAPVTNALWLRYLADIILDQKVPSVVSSEDRQQLKEFRKTASSANKAGELVWDQLFSKLWDTSSGSGGLGGGVGGDVF